MAVKIRLRRVGAKKAAIYRIVAADIRAPRDGRYIEIVGQYNPLTNPSTVVLHHDRIKYWLSNGAKPTDVVKRLLIADGLWEEFSGEVPAPRPVKVKKEEVVEETPVTEEVPVVEETLVVEEAPAVEEVPVVEEAPAEEVETEPEIEIAVEVEDQGAEEKSE